MPEHENLDYVEFATKDVAASKSFFTTAFDWKFTDYGPDYTAFARSDAGLDGGFFKSDKAASTELGSALVIFYSSDLESTLAKVEDAGGTVVKPTFSFPGGRRFEFVEPGGNQLAVWSDQGLE
ncbi:MAG: VOC family protein [Calditrichia bacterium]